MQIRFLLPGIFNELMNDHPKLILLYVKHLNEYILKNQSISHKIKVAFFSGYFLDQMGNIYKKLNEDYKDQDTSNPFSEWNEFKAKKTQDKEDDEENEEEMYLRYKASEKNLLNYLHGFLNELCCSEKAGIVYKDPDWYIGRPITLKYRNKSLLRLILLLKPSTCINQQRLVLNILSVAPDIIESYIKQITISFESRLTFKWLENISFITKIISLPPPPIHKFKSKSIIRTDELLTSLSSSNPFSQSDPSSDGTNSNTGNVGMESSISGIGSGNDQIPPSDHTILLNNLIPPVLNIRNLFTQCLTSESKLIKYQFLIILSSIFMKLNKIKSSIQLEIKNSSHFKNEWKNYFNKFIQDVRKQLPELSLIIQCYSFIVTQFNTTQSPSPSPSSNPASSLNQYYLLYDKILSLFYFYKIYFKGVFSDFNFDTLKLISSDFIHLPLSIQSTILLLLSDSNLLWTNKRSYPFLIFLLSSILPIYSFLYSTLLFLSLLFLPFIFSLVTTSTNIPLLLVCSSFWNEKFIKFSNIDR